MATATAPRFTKPRVSALILESTAATVALVLLLWLLLWFMWQIAGAGQIEAYFVPTETALAEEVPYQSSDVRLLRGAPTTDGRWETKPSELLEAVQQIISGSGSPAVIYVNDPVVTSNPGTTDGQAPMERIISLIRMIGEKSQRDVILALDLAQVDSDRDLGVFGNSPYQGLAERVAELPAGKRTVLILTSCAPAQKSWNSDGLGQSAFSYYLRKGLEGDARRWDRTRQEVTAEGLYRYVRAHVSAWAKKNCRAIQTPMLIPLGKSPGRVTLPILPQAAALKSPVVDQADAAVPRASIPPEQKELAKEKEPAKANQTTTAQEKEKPVSRSAREALFRDIMIEWKAHDRLRAQDPPPYRHSPGAWRYYEFTLLQAERRLRAAWLAEDRLNPGRVALESAGDQRATIENALKKQGDEELAFPFHPAVTKEGRKELDEALAYLTRARKAVGPAPGPQPAQSAAGSNEPPIPRSLRDVGEGDYPRPYLELQLPVWAQRFTESFRVPDYFRQTARSDPLGRLVEVRSKAENALAIDYRGARYVEPIVNSGDAIRRLVQDNLFALTSGDAGGQGISASQLNNLGKTYDAALSVIQAFHEARGVLEEIAAELPDLAEWHIRHRSHELTADQAFPVDLMPGPVENLIVRAQGLIQVLDREIPRDQGANLLVDSILKWARDLKNLTESSASALRDLQNDVREGTRVDLTNDWVMRDLALRSPLLPTDRRADILKKVLESTGEVRLAPPEDGSSQLSDENPPDGGFWIRAAGLMSLDLALGQLGGGTLGERGPQGRRLQEIWPVIRSLTGTPGSEEGLFRAFSDFSTATRKFRQAAVTRSDQPRARDRTLDEIERSLRLEDRLIRFLCTGEIRQLGATTIDEPVAAYDTFGRYASLRFHRARLDEDFVLAANLEELGNTITYVGRKLGINTEPEPLRYSQSLAIDVTPAGTIHKVNDRGEASFKVGIAQPSQRDGIGSIPKGHAMLGVARLTDDRAWDVRLEGAETGVPGVLREVPPPLSPPAPVPVQVTQNELRAEGLSKLGLEAMVFYRGRVDAQGKSAIAVTPKIFKELVVVSITQDREVLNIKYGKELADRIVDQFSLHPGEGYMHKGKDLAYVLTVKNVSPRNLKVQCLRSLVDSPIKLDDKPRSEELKPLGEIKITDVMTSEMVPVESPKQLKFTVQDENGKDLIKPMVVTFKQIQVPRYMEFEEATRIDEFRGEIMPCYVVTYRRRSDDPVTEPIMGREISCTIEGVQASPRDDAPFFRGKELITTHPRREGAKEWKWSGRMENEELKEKTVLIRP